MMWFDLTGPGKVPSHGPRTLATAHRLPGKKLSFQPVFFFLQGWILAQQAHARDKLFSYLALAVVRGMGLRKTSAIKRSCVRSQSKRQNKNPAQARARRKTKKRPLTMCFSFRYKLVAKRKFVDSTYLQVIFFFSRRFFFLRKFFFEGTHPDFYHRTDFTSLGLPWAPSEKYLEDNIGRNKDRFVSRR